MKFLIEHFRPAVDFDPKSMSDLPHGYLRLDCLRLGDPTGLVPRGE